MNNEIQIKRFVSWLKIHPFKKTKTIFATKKQGRNEICACGSMKKYKHCCWKKENEPGGLHE